MKNSLLIPAVAILLFSSCKDVRVNNSQTDPVNVRVVYGQPQPPGEQPTPQPGNADHKVYFHLESKPTDKTFSITSAANEVTVIEAVYKTAGLEFPNKLTIGGYITSLTSNYITGLTIVVNPGETIQLNTGNVPPIGANVYSVHGFKQKL